MHPYSTDSARQRTVLLVLAVLAIFLAWGLGQLFELLGTSPPWWLDTPAVVGFYALLWQAYDRWLWRLGRPDRTLSGVPYFGGTWTGEILSSYQTEPYPARLTIRQTSSRILVELDTGRSRSQSRLAMVCAAPGWDQGLQYLYENRPGERAAELSQHDGTAYLRFDEDGRQLKGGYFTDPKRGNQGELIFRREPEGERVPG